MDPSKEKHKSKAKTSVWNSKNQWRENEMG